ncbi:hypothetical protein Aduo_008210 [Ancylostoma duodenale]
MKVDLLDDYEYTECHFYKECNSLLHGATSICTEEAVILWAPKRCTFSKQSSVHLVRRAPLLTCNSFAVEEQREWAISDQYQPNYLVLSPPLFGKFPDSPGTGAYENATAHERGGESFNTNRFCFLVATFLKEEIEWGFLRGR